MSAWPDGARGALSLSFDNLGEAAEIGVGALAPEAAQVGTHATAGEVLPRLLDRLDDRGLAATFFVEGLNAELYPGLLREVGERGHEVGFHAWTHEQWGELTAAEQEQNLARGIAAFEEIGLAPRGMRPPGGQLGAGGVEVLRDAGLRYASPAGKDAGAEDGLALVPFQWRHVDATCVLPPLDAVRKEMTGSTEPIEPGRFSAFLEAELAGLAKEGGFATFVFHPFLLEWLGEDRLGSILTLVAETAERGDLWVAPCAEVAEHVLAGPGAFEGGTVLDPTAW